MAAHARVRVCKMSTLQPEFPLFKKVATFLSVLPHINSDYNKSIVWENLKLQKGLWSGCEMTREPLWKSTAPSPSTKQTLTRGRLSDSACQAHGGLFYWTKIYCAANLQKRWHALCSVLSLAVWDLTKAWNLSGIHLHIQLDQQSSRSHMCQGLSKRAVVRLNALDAHSVAA